VLLSASLGYTGRCSWAFLSVLILVPGRYLKRFVPGFSFLVFRSWALLVRALLIRALLVKAVLVKALLVLSIANSGLGGFRLTRCAAFDSRASCELWLASYGWLGILRGVL
jgi:hypothetical protein